MHFGGGNIWCLNLQIALEKNIGFIVIPEKVMVIFRCQQGIKAE